MNILHLKYAVEVEKTRSISKAAENLYMGQPNLSRAIKELEDSLGIKLFNRTSRGITPTARGEEFLQQAKKILADIDKLENLYKDGREDQKLSVSVPRTSYIACAFYEFVKDLDQSRGIEILYKETNSLRAIDNIMHEDFKLAIIRYQTVFEQYFKVLFHEKGFTSEVILEFTSLIIVSKNSPLAAYEDIPLTELSDYTEIAYSDAYVPSLSVLEAKKAELSEFVNRRIFVFERASQFELLNDMPDTFMRDSQIPEEYLEKYGLVQRRCSADRKKYKDVLIYRKGTRLSETDHKFIAAVKKYANLCKNSDESDKADSLPDD